ncbi:Transcriptional regulator, histone-like protein, AbrB family [Saccharolobus shibatae B12]|uniref:Transcriptional regulator, histone-like protein, AbrB family n=1 Tax=Saccharolobus shibatae (strain ATCC 51178 / DSM 5389 / JCM 8931 / NBRC 15437 / B12) TaxID=523848 RepID=A0A8F5GSF9_SACSH|nr:AbrB/MazE/SpoVT family DNA-binding domain-containing protein [Saccharolobus shibatae]QXJ27824.1 Transcriptional regulator, histone-like protein, AbrB family [Saccharolobus shibatae B12]
MVKPYIRKGGREGDETYYLNIPRDIARALNIAKDDEFVLSVDTRDGEVRLCYKRLKK